MVPPFVSRYVFHGGDPNMIALACFFHLLNIAIAFTFCHLIITKVGMIFVEAEVLREGNEQLLNNLDEGLIITDEKSKVLLFQNKSARAAQKFLPPMSLKTNYSRMNISV